MNKYKSSASSIVVASIFLIHLVNGAQFLSTTCVSVADVTVILPLTKMWPLILKLLCYR